MEDGIRLSTDVFLPSGSGGPYPALLMRTPYDKTRVEDGRMIYTQIIAEAVEAGYAVAIQDLRGRFESDGDFVPFHENPDSDAQDGAATVAWIRTQQWCDGSVAMWGDSYGAWTQWKVAIDGEQKPDAILPSGLPMSALDSPVLRPARRILWYVGRMGPDSRRRAEQGGRSLDEQSAYRNWRTVERSRWLWFLPWKELPDYLLGGLSPHYQGLLESRPGDYLSWMRGCDEFEGPVLLLTGWFDIDVGSVIELHERLKNTRDESSPAYLIVGPWKHMDPKYDLSRYRGSIDFGEDAQWSYPDVLAQWSDFAMKGKSGPLFPGPPIRYFAMGDGSNQWREATRWSEVVAPAQRFFFTSDGGSAGNEGALSEFAPEETAMWTYVYDPRDPVPSAVDEDAYYGPFDIGYMDLRPDVLSFATAPLDQAVELRGSVHVDLVATSSAVDTDFCAWVAEERPDGSSVLIASGFVRGRYRNGIDQEQFLEPGKPERIRIRCRPTVYRLAEGSRLVVKISSSDFPDYDRNHNLGTDPYSDARLVAATQSLRSGPDHPCSVSLPVSRPVR